MVKVIAVQGQLLLTSCELCLLLQCDRIEFDWFPDCRLRGCNLAIGLAEVNEKMLVI
ncbi:MAG: hypothetical protein AAF378_03655 [Cyanobacteria bacterium P01_A01_bin.84]